MGDTGGPDEERKGMRRVTVLMSRDLYDRFDAYCRKAGFKKSTLIARLVRELLGEASSPRKEERR